MPRGEVQSAAMMARYAEFCEARTEGRDMFDAGAALGLGERTVKRYERARRAALGLPDQPQPRYDFPGVR